jgi:hypothetical protein
VIAFELVAAVFLMINSLKISHRVAGPSYRICKSLERIRSGDLAFAVNLRKGDHLGEIRDELNKLLDWLNDLAPPGCVTRAQAAQRELEAAAAASAATEPPTTTGPATAAPGPAATEPATTAPRAD